MDTYRATSPLFTDTEANNWFSTQDYSNSQIVILFSDEMGFMHLFFLQESTGGEGGGGGGGTPLYLLYGDVPLDRVWFSGIRLEQGIQFA